MTTSLSNITVKDSSHSLVIKSNDITIDDTSIQTQINSKQNILVSGTDIKTINNQSILGSGNLSISATPDYTTITNTVLNIIYPVGSVYIGTQSTCPLATLISGSSWSTIATNIVVGVNTNVPVKGNGMTLGVTKDNSTVNTLIGSYGIWSGASGTNLFVDNYNKNIGSSSSHNNVPGAIGVTTDSSKSGIVGTVTRTNLAVNIWKRTA